MIQPLINLKLMIQSRKNQLKKKKRSKMKKVMQQVRLMKHQLPQPPMLMQLRKMKLLIRIRRLKILTRQVTPLRPLSMPPKLLRQKRKRKMKPLADSNFLIVCSSSSALRTLHSTQSSLVILPSWSLFSSTANRNCSFLMCSHLSLMLSIAYCSTSIKNQSPKFSTSSWISNTMILRAHLVRKSKSSNTTLLTN